MTKLERLEKEFKDAVDSTSFDAYEAWAEVKDAAWATAYDKWKTELKRVELEKLKDRRK